MYVVGPAVWAFTIIPKFITKSLLKSDKLENPAVTTGELRSLIDIGEEAVSYTHLRAHET